MNLSRVLGGRKAARIIKARDPNFYKRMGVLGGKASKTGGFASEKIGKDGLTGKERARMAGKKGGKRSRRTK